MGYTIYTVDLDGGTLDRDERLSVAACYREALEQHFGSAAAVLEAVQATELNACVLGCRGVTRPVGSAWTSWLHKRQHVRHQAGSRRVGPARRTGKRGRQGATLSCRAPTRVLVLDDHPDAAEVMAVLLADACPGTETQFALDGAAGLSIALDWFPHLVVTDIDMPLLNGLQAALEMRTLLPTRQPVIVAVTGHPQWSNDARAIAAFDVVLMKPVGVEKLVQWVTTALDRTTH